MLQPSACHNTMESQLRKPTARSVYGKRKDRAPKAVFEIEQDSIFDATDESGDTSATSSATNQENVDALVENLPKDMETLDIQDRPWTNDNEEIDTPSRREREMLCVQISSPASAGHSDAGHNTTTTTDFVPSSAPTEATQMRGIPRKQPPSSPTKVGQSATNPSTLKPANRRRPSNNDSTNSDLSCETSTRGSSGLVNDDLANAYVRPILKEACSPISSNGIRKFSCWAQTGEDMFRIEKLAEGSYGEVYQLKLRSESKPREPGMSKRLSVYRDVIFKIVPLRAQRGPGSKKYTSVDEIVAEVKLMKMLDPIPGFARFREAHVVQGRFPDPYQKAWDIYSKNHPNDCFNPNPSKKKNYPDSQLWVILEMDNAGFELEKYTWTSAFQMYDIFWGVAMGLARAEQFACFEHRDLHLGNICIKARKSRIKDLGTSSLSDPTVLPTGFGYSGLETNIIDYSLSRAELKAPPQEGSCEEATPSVNVAWSDLDAREIFGAEGQDPDDQLLRDTYRHMRSQIYHHDPMYLQRDTIIPEKWKEYNPQTNVIWLRFILKMLLRKYNPKQLYKTIQDELHIPKQSAHHSALMERSVNQKMKKNSGKLDEKGGKQRQMAMTPDTTAVSNVATWNDGLLGRLEIVEEMLEFDRDEEKINSAGDLVTFAIGYGWLDEHDFFDAQ